MRNSNSVPIWFGLPFFVAGLFILGFAFGIVPADPASVHAPPWVLAACGLVFVLSGVAVFTQRYPRIRSSAAVSIILAMGLIGAWVAFWGNAEQMSGGLPFISREVNVALGRGLFGLGALLSLGLFVWGASRLARGHTD